MAFVSLTRGYKTEIDDSDVELVSRYKWRASTVSRSGCIYAHSFIRDENGKPGVLAMHRLLLSAPSDMQVDHVNGNGLDNRRANIRLCSALGNARNARKRSRWVGTKPTSRFKGVTWKKRSRSNWERWFAQIRLNGSMKHLGYFNDEFEAARAYDMAAKKHFGEFARLNFPIGV